MIGGKRGIRVIEKTIKLSDIEPDVCRSELGGYYESEDETCIIKLRFDESKPYEVDLIEIKRRSV